MTAITEQFRNTAIHLFIDLSAAFSRDVKDKVWAEGFLFPALGSLGHECGGFLKMEEGSPLVKGSLGGISFAQWTGMGKRRRGLFMALCRKMKLHPYSYEAAIAMILTELAGTHKNVAPATLAAKVLDNTPKPKDALMARVVRFEMLYEGAGIKHYPGRYQFAVMAREVWTDWVAAGCPAPKPFQMPRARFTDDFDREFGPGTGPKTVRAPSNPYRVGQYQPGPNQKPSPPPAAKPVGRQLVRAPAAAPGGAYIPGVTVQKGRWPEEFLTAEDITHIQARLRDLGYVRLGTVNGRWDSDMVATISKLQTNAGIEVDGHWGADTAAALQTGVREVVTPERANATKDSLKDVGEPVIVKTEPVKRGAWWSTVGGSIAAVVAGVSPYIETAKGYLDPIRDLVGDVPAWVWFVIVAGIAYALYRRVSNVQGTVVDGFRKGEVLTVEKPPALPEGMKRFDLDPEARERLAALGRSNAL